MNMVEQYPENISELHTSGCSGATGHNCNRQKSICSRGKPETLENRFSEGGDK